MKSLILASKQSYTLGLILGLMLSYSAAQADYRAYELAIVDKESGTEKTVISTLDHIQYPGYHPLMANESIYYLSSWMCWGNSSHFKPTCPKPELQVQEPTQKPKTQP